MAEATVSNASPQSISQLTLAVNYDQISASLELPLAAMVTFSTLPKNAEEQAALQAQMELFKELDHIMHFPPSAECTIQELNLSTRSIRQNNNEASFYADYKISCSKPRYLDRLTVTLFDQYQQIGKLVANLSSSGLKRHSELTPVKRYLILR